MLGECNHQPVSPAIAAPGDRNPDYLTHREIDAR